MRENFHSLFFRGQKLPQLHRMMQPAYLEYHAMSPSSLIQIHCYNIQPNFFSVLNWKGLDGARRTTGGDRILINFANRIIIWILQYFGWSMRSRFLTGWWRWHLHLHFCTANREIKTQWTSAVIAKCIQSKCIWEKSQSARKKNFSIVKCKGQKTLELNKNVKP